MKTTDPEEKAAFEDKFGFAASPTDIEDLAKELHEAGRAAVEQGNTVAAEKFGEQTRKFIEWEELTEPAKDGRRIQAVYLLQKYHIREKRHE